MAAPRLPDQHPTGSSSQARWRRWRWLLALAAAVVTTTSLSVQAIRSKTAVPGWSLRARPVAPVVTPLAQLQARFIDPSRTPGTGDYEALARYLIEGWSAYRSPDGERAHYPGVPSLAGRPVDGLEGFARFFPLAAAWLASGRSARFTLPDGELDLAGALARGLVVGTDPAHPAYWGDVTDFSPQLVESADIALGLWLARDQLLPRLSQSQRQQVFAWLSPALRARAHDGNWQLFALTVHRALRALGADVSRFDERMQTSWETFRSLHRGDGWFFDPPNGYDYYNAWSIHYSLHWIRQMDPNFEPGFIDGAQAAFVDTYRHLLGPQGHPLMGRSSCYRMAAPAPLLANALSGPKPSVVSIGEALRSLDTTWSWFIRHGALDRGGVTAGFCGDDPALQARYSGPASCLWSLRSLVIAFAHDRSGALFDRPREPLAVERGNYRIVHPVTGWTIVGWRDAQRIDLEMPSRDGEDRHNGGAGGDPPLRAHGPGARLVEAILQAPRRPDNHAALYGRRLYSTATPLARCER